MIEYETNLLFEFRRAFEESAEIDRTSIEMSVQNPPLLNGNPYPGDRFFFASDSIYGTVLDIACKAGYLQKDKPDRQITGLDLDQLLDSTLYQIRAGQRRKTPVF